jgi:hypothetical protein
MARGDFDDQLNEPAIEDDISGDDEGSHFGDFWDSFWNTPGVSEMDPASPEFAGAEEVYNTGWVDPTVSADEREEARNQYYEMFDMDEGDFDWQSWREAMGYE